MPWVRLEPAAVIGRMCVQVDPGKPGDADDARRTLEELRAGLLSGRFVAVQHRTGATFIGTPAEAAGHVLETDLAG